MRNERSEHTANLALAQAPAIANNMTIGLHFGKPVPARARSWKQKRKFAQTFRDLFRNGKAHKE